MKKSLRLYHFTSLFHLDNILAQGLKRGELAGTGYRGTGVVSLSKRETPTLAFWAGSNGQLMDKLKVRITAQIEKGPRLMRWRDALDKFGLRVPKQQLDPMRDGHNWYCHFGIIPAAALSFETRNGQTYETIRGEALSDLAAKIEAEKANWVTQQVGPMLYCGLKRGVRDSFLLDGSLRDDYLREAA